MPYITIAEAKQGTMKFSHLLIIFITLVFVACTNTSTAPSANNEIVVTDFRGSEITLKKPAERVICLIESALSGIYMLQQKKRVIAVPSAVYTDELFPYYARLDSRIASRSMPAPGNWDFISIEEIVGLKPDLVIIWSSQTDAIENIEQFGIPVYAVMLHSFADIYKEIQDFGKLLNSAERADSLIQYTKEKMAAMHKKTKNENPKSAYFMWAQGITQTSGKKSTVNELLAAAGVKNACQLSDEHVSVSIEKIYDWDPDLIVMWYNEKLDPVDIINDPLLQGLRAIKEQQVYELPEVFASDFWTLKMQYPAQLISNWAYGENADKENQTQQLKNIYLQLYNKKLID